MILTSALATDPCGNTGSNGQTVTSGYTLRIDWLNLTGTFETEAQALQVMEDIAYSFGEDGAIVWQTDRGMKKGRWYDHSAKTPHGTVFLWHKEQSSGHYSFFASIPAKALARTPLRLQLRAFREFKLAGLKATRVDVALDDFTKSFSFENLSEAVDKKNYAYFRDAYTLFTKKGKTVYFGSRQSEMFGRIYDKFLESLGLINSHRLELVLSGNRAKSFWQMLTMIPTNDREDLDESERLAIELMRETIIGGFKFIERGSEVGADGKRERVDRCPLLPWWEKFVQFVQSAGGMRIPSERRVSHLASKKTWIEKQVATSLSMIREAMGGDFAPWLHKLLKSGKSRRTTEAHKIMHLHKMNYDVLPKLEPDKPFPGSSYFTFASLIDDYVPEVSG
ncbi:MAG TPA: replication initiation factor domain-containing protein [Coleofasciculaceae cyanobacterium]|jgi:hypothetical protein